MKPYAQAWAQTHWSSLLWGCLALALAVRCATLTSAPLWNDEAFSWAITRGSFSDMVGHLQRDFHPPAYYALLWVWMQALGDAVAAMRLLSVGLSVASIGLMVHALRPWMSAGASLLAGLLLALHPVHVLWGFSVRGYGLLYFAMALAFWGASAWLQSARPQAERCMSSAPAGFVQGAYALGCLVAAYTHNMGLAAWAGLAAAVAFGLLRADRRLIPRFLGLNVVAAIAYAPWMASLMGQSKVMATAMPSHYAAVDAQSLAEALFEWAFVSHVYTARWVVVVAMLAFIGLGVWHLRKNPLLPLLLWPLLLIWGMGLVGVYVLNKPLTAYMLQTSRWAHLLVLPLVVGGLFALGRRSTVLVALASVAVLLVAGYGMQNMLRSSRVDWPRVVESALREAPEARYVAASELSLWAPMYYLSRRERRIDLFTAPPSGAAVQVMLSNGRDDPAWLLVQPYFQQTGTVRDLCMRGACAHVLAVP